MSKKTIFYIGFFILLTAGFLFTMAKVIPGFGDVKMPVLSYVQPFSFINQDGKKMTEADTKGKVYVAEYFFTTCKSICPKMKTNLRKVYDTYRNEDQFLILSHTVDPDIDTVGRLKAYADSLKLTGGNWQFLTGSKDSLYNAARVSYLLDDPKNNSVDIEEQFLHTQFLALVDKNGQVRKIYDALKKEELKDLETDISTLLQEPEKNAK